MDTLRTTITVIWDFTFKLRGLLDAISDYTGTEAVIIVTLEEAMKGQKGSTGIALLFN